MHPKRGDVLIAEAANLAVTTCSSSSKSYLNVGIVSLISANEKLEDLLIVRIL